MNNLIRLSNTCSHEDKLKKDCLFKWAINDRVVFIVNIYRELYLYFDVII